MGLDVTAYSNIKMLKGGITDTDYDLAYSNDDVCLFSVNDDFEEQSEGLLTGVYRVDKSRAAWSRSSSGYSLFLDWLSKTLAGVSAEDLRRNPLEYGDIRLLVAFGHYNVNDYEGVINSKCCQKILKVMQDNQKVLQDNRDRLCISDPEVIAKWMKGLELASQNGCLYFS